MDNEINLKEVLGVQIKPEEEKFLRENKGYVPIQYVSALNNIFGAETAVEVVQKHTLDDILKGEELLDKFKFTDNPQNAKEKVRRVLEILDWNEQLNTFSSRDYQLGYLTSTYSGFKKLNERLVAEEDRKIRDWFFFRDVLTGVTGKLLEHYGIEITPENSSLGHVGQSAAFCSHTFKVLPGLSTDELVDYLITKELAGQRIQQYDIIGGFDDAKAALEVASIPNGDHGRKAKLYKDFGFTSLSAIKEISIEDLEKVDQGFNLGEDGSRGTEKRKRLFVHNYVKGNKEKLEKMLEVADKPNAGKYLFAFNGSMDNTHRFLTHVSDDERPSPEAIKYVRDIFGKTEFKQTLDCAKEIDSPLIKSDFWPLAEIKQGNVEHTDYDQLVILTKQYRFANENYKKATGNNDLNKNGYQLYQESNCDLRFLKELNIDLNTTYTNSPYLLEANLISSTMSYDAFQELKIDSDKKARLVVRLLEKGYTGKEIQETFNGDVIYSANLEGILWSSDNMKIPLRDIAEIAQYDVDPKYTIGMLNTIPFKGERKTGPNSIQVFGKIPYGLLPALAAHNISQEQLNAFGNSIDLKKYTLSGNFDGVSFIADIKTFYNLNPIENK